MVMVRNDDHCRANLPNPDKRPRFQVTSSFCGSLVERLLLRTGGSSTRENSGR